MIQIQRNGQQAKIRQAEFKSLAMCLLEWLGFALIMMAHVQLGTKGQLACIIYVDCENKHGLYTFDQQLQTNVVTLDS